MSYEKEFIELFKESPRGLTVYELRKNYKKKYERELGTHTNTVYIALSKMVKENTLRIERPSEKLEKDTSRKLYILNPESVRKESDIELVKHIKFLNGFFKDNIEYLIRDPYIDGFIEKNESKFEEIEEVCGNAKFS